VVDGEREDAAPVVAGPTAGDGEQGQGVSAAGQGEGEGPVGTGFKPCGQPVPNAVKPGRVGPGRNGGAQPALRAAGQANWVRSAVARERTAALAAAA